MPFKGTRSRPQTAAEEKQPQSFESPSTIRQSSPLRGHRKSSSWKKLNLSFSLGHDDPFQNFLLHDANESTSTQILEGSGPSTPGNGDREGKVVNNGSGSLSGPGPAVESEGQARNRSTSRIRENGRAGQQQQQNTKSLKAALPSNVVTTLRHRKRTEGENDQSPSPSIITTAPTDQFEPQTQKKGKDKLLSKGFGFRKNQNDPSLTTLGDSKGRKSSDLMTLSSPNLSESKSRENLSSMANISNQPAPPAYGEEGDSALAVPVSRLSESSRSEGSSASHKLYAQTTTTHIISTTTSFFKIKRNNKKKKDKGPLFPLPEHLPPPSSGRTSFSRNAGDSSTIGRKSISPSRKSVQAVRFDTNNGARQSPISSPIHSSAALPGAQLGSPGPAITRKYSTLSTHSGASTPSVSLMPPRLGARGRSSTMGSMGRSSERVDSVGPVPSGRTSTSTTGRKSFGDLFMSHRMRQNSAPPRHGVGTFSNPDSKANSFQIAREPEPELVYPKREDSDTPASYLEKLEAAIPRGAMATVLCKNGDDFSKTCLRKYMRGFSYFGESIDMSIRKMLMEVILPKETQQIDRLLSGFADRYHECNPGIFTNADEANFVAFSILLLQSDSHNKNNKRKMTKQDYIKNTQNEKISVADDILECFYDNICYTPFIHFEDEVAVNSHRLGTPRSRKGLIKTKSNENLRGPVDPYALILDNKLDMLRPSLKDAIDTEDTYSSTGSMLLPNSNEFHKYFVNSAVLQIVSARSRPDAFKNQATITNPAEAQAGLVSIKVAKVGFLWRKSTKKKKAKSPWQEWGAILTDSKLYFFKDVGWVKRLTYQYESHKKSPAKSGALVFKPPVTSFDPDALMGVDDAVALTDSSYKKHKHAFTFIKHGGFEEVFLANTEADMNDWLGKLNYAATFRTAGVRMRGLLGTTYEGRQLLRKDSETSANATGSLLNEKPLPDPKDSPEMTWEIMFYRRQLVSEKISAFDDHVANAQKELEYLLRNSRHLLIQLPIQPKTREGMVFAAGRMNAKLKWTRKEIWRAKTHRDVLIKDLEAESTLDFHNIANPMGGRSPLIAPSEKSSTTKASHDPLSRQDTDKSIISLSSPFMTPQITRAPPQAILDKIQTDNAVPPELTKTRRPSASSYLSPASKSNLVHGEPHTPGHIEGKAEVHSLVTQPSTVSSHNMQNEDEWSAKFEESYEDRFRPESLILSSPESRDKRRGSETERDNTPAISHTRDSSLKDRTSGVRRSLHRTLREPHHVHIPGHQRSKKGKESNSSIAATEDGTKSIGGESEELRRDPTGRFVLHGKKASVVTMGPEWQRLTPEERIKLRQPSVVEGSSHHSGTAEEIASPSSSKADYLRPFATPVGSSSMLSEMNAGGEVFHSASSSRRASFGSTDREEEGED